MKEAPDDIFYKVCESTLDKGWFAFGYENVFDKKQLIIAFCFNLAHSLK